MSEPETSRHAVATWRVVLAFILDFFTAFLGLGFLVAWATGGLTEKGFSLEGGPAFLLFAGVVAYYVILNRFFGGTIWKHILRAQRVPRRVASGASSTSDSTP
ncbi:hypothetical protein L0F51_19610 [Afifella sp. H1R]|uniref:hypothetical protein n=1 Tax=Afifella sp. H1R TaxID=2908841 RepID=UPI001F3EDDD2|nr:hypothetical protein [Afifella sp. H1R]MCF1505971.1 hypothetical protein [Afifella sp. H1R]